MSPITLHIHLYLFLHFLVLNVDILGVSVSAIGEFHILERWHQPSKAN